MIFVYLVYLQVQTATFLTKISVEKSSSQARPARSALPSSQPGNQTRQRQRQPGRPASLAARPDYSSSSCHLMFRFCTSPTTFLGIWLEFLLSFGKYCMTE